MQSLCFIASVLLSTKIIQRLWKVSKRMPKAMLSTKKYFFPESLRDFQTSTVSQQNDYLSLPNTNLGIVWGNQKQIVPALVDATVMPHLWSSGAFKVVSFSIQVLAVVSKGMFWAIFQLFQEASCQIPYKTSPSSLLLSIFIGPCGELMRRNRFCSYQHENVFCFIWFELCVFQKHIKCTPKNS